MTCTCEDDGLVDGREWQPIDDQDKRRTLPSQTQNNRITRRCCIQFLKWIVVWWCRQLNQPLLFLHRPNPISLSLVSIYCLWLTCFATLDNIEVFLTYLCVRNIQTKWAVRWCTTLCHIIFTAHIISNSCIRISRIRFYSFHPHIDYFVVSSSCSQMEMELNSRRNQLTEVKASWATHRYLWACDVKLWRCNKSTGKNCVISSSGSFSWLLLFMLH